MKKSGASSSTGTRTGSMKFCPKCENLLHLKEDTKRKLLLLACPTCPYQVRAKEQDFENPQFNILQVEAENNSKESDEKNEDMLALFGEGSIFFPENDLSCPVCGHRKAEIYVPNMEERMVPAYACLNPKCGHS